MHLNCTPEYILDAVCRTLELDVEKIRSKVRETEYCDGRFITAYLLKMICDDIRYSTVGATLLNRKKTVVRDQKRKCGILLKTNKNFRAKYELVIDQLKCAKKEKANARI